MAKKLMIGTIVGIGGLLLIGAFWFMSAYNKMVALDEGISGAWANVESAYQRRADLIPNLVNTVKGYADFEQKTLTDVVEARAKATSVQLNADDLSPEKIQQFQAAQDELGGTLSRLLVSVEAYPDLKASANFRELQSQLEGTENRIKVERDRFNESVKTYNSYIRSFPASMVANQKGFETKGYFNSTAGSEVAPEVSF